MNTKKNKNKNRANKPQNPNPPQKLEPESQKSEPVSEVVDSALKSEERVPEIISEVVNLPASDIKEETGNDSPKKPKRNRGKKKKGDVEESKAVEKIPETAVETKPGEVKEVVQIETYVIVKNDENLPMTPAARNKKGKNKSNTQQTEKPKEENISKVEKVESKAEEQKMELKEVSSEQTETGEQEPKASKKKNKKNKKRNDSETSDKAEELSCTSAFQKILSQTDDLKEQLVIDTKIEDIKESDSSFSEPTIKELEISFKNMTSQKIIDDTHAKTEVSVPPAISDLSHAAIVPEPSKNKKKNKKHNNKHLQLTETDIEPAFTVSLETKAESSTSTGKIKETETSNISSLLSVETNITEVSTDPSQTSKSKIVKSVEKKGKGKSDIKTQLEKPIIPKGTETQKVSEQKHIIEETQLDTTDLCSSPDCTQPTEHTKAQKKKGKGKLIIAEVEIIPDLSDIPEDVMPKELKELDVMALSETITPEKPLNIQDINQSETIKHPAVIAIEKQTETINLPEIDSLKKRKKSPKSTSAKKDKETAVKDLIIPEQSTTEIVSQIKSTESVIVPSKDTGSITPDESTTTSKDKISKQETQRNESPKPLTKLEKKEVETIKKAMKTAEPLAQISHNIDPVSITTQPEMNTPKVNLDILKKSITESVKHIESIEIPEIEPRKQRKKSPKLPIKTEESTAEGASVKDPTISETSKELKQTMPVVSIDHNIGKDVIEKSKEVNILKVPVHEPRVQRKKSPNPSTKPSALAEESSKKIIVETSPPTPRTEDMPKLIPIGSELELPLNVETVKDITTKSLDSMKIPDQETGKKRKKSPKPSKKPEQIAEKAVKYDADISVQESVDKIAEETKEPTPISLADILKMETKTPSTVTEVKFPDLIEHPRAVSADVIDNNNNTFIQEFIPPESKLSVPLIIPDTPFIQGSTEVPLVSPDIVSSGVRVMDIKTSAELTRNASQKHDLKSKVMEVNQDMEDLRMSIERSLAELTALEKKDEEFEKRYAFGQLSSEDVKKYESEKTDKDEEPRKDITEKELKVRDEIQSAKPKEAVKPDESTDAPVCPSRKDNKGKGKSKKKGGYQPHQPQSVSTTESSATASTRDSKDNSSQETKKEEKTEQKDQTKSSEQKGKQQSASTDNETGITEIETNKKFDPIENFEDALTSSVDDVNKTFEVIAKEATDDKDNPEISITEPDEEDKSSKEKKKNVNPLSQPKNLLGHPDIPVPSNRTDYKKEKNKPPNTRQAKVKIKDSVDIEKGLKHSKQSQTENKKLIKNTNANETVCVTSENDEYVYKYSFRKVFLSSNCHTCKKDLSATRIPCSFCSLIFYCNQKHRDEDWPQHQAFCFAVSTIVHLKGLKHIYASATNITGQAYRLLRMQMIVSCEKVLKRKLSPCEQEMLLYPRICGEASCREWRQGKLQDCAGCGQISFCADNSDHLPKNHARWCKSYCLYRKLVVYQLTRGRLEPRLPGRLMSSQQMSDNINRLLADMYEEKIDMSDMQYASLTQLATAPLTAAYCYQIYSDAMKTVVANGVHKTTFTIHVVGAELQFEADSLNKWEVFFLHLKPDVQLLRVVLVGPELNPSKLPLDLLGKIKLCATCRLDKRRVVFSFRDRQTFHDYYASDDFLKPDIVCAFNPSINRSSMYDNQNWTSTVNSILKLKVPLVLTSYTMNELQRDLSTIKTIAKEDFNTISEAKFNPFSSVRPDRNFITDDEMPLLFKNYCYMVLIGAF